MSLKEYILQEKMKTAQAILRSTSLPVAVVAARVGFENYSYFSQVYKKVIGITPSAARGKPVSYTHLDVYKRQDQHGPCSAVFQ